MTAEIRITVKGLDRARQLMRATPGKISEALAMGLAEASQIVAGEAKKALTVGPTRALRTGRLRASVGGGGFSGGSFMTGQGIDILGLRAVVGPTVDYAIYVHEGTRYMQARPFMEVAHAASVKPIERAFEYHIQQALP